MLHRGRRPGLSAFIRPHRQDYPTNSPRTRALAAWGGHFKSFAQPCPPPGARRPCDIAGEELKRRGIPLPALSETIKHNAGLLGRLEQRMRSDTLKYTRLRNRVLGTRSGGSRVYQMLGLGPVEALRRLVLRPTDGLKFLLDNDALDLSAEMLALDPEFESVIPEDIRIRARANLAIVGVKAEDLKKIN